MWRGLLMAACLIVGCSKHEAVPEWPRQPLDLPETTANPFKDMDGGIDLTDDEIRGRDTWLLWSADNATFWDWMARYSYGSVDLLRTLDSRRRTSRFREMGVMNEPGFRPAAATDPYGLWLDERVEPEPEGIDPQVYGRSSGVVGLRLYRNPAFDAAAKVAWDPEKYYGDARYSEDPRLVRPYRVGMACGFCHVAFNPLRPPTDPENPGWQNLSSSIGNQYLRAAAIFGNERHRDGFIYQLLAAAPRGTIDTSFVATDNVYNPSTMNAIFEVPARLSIATEEAIAGGALDLADVRTGMKVPHVLKDGADSVGLFGALSRVFINIGEFSDEWLRCHNPIVGGMPQRPIAIAKAEKESVYWRATAMRLEHLAAFFVKAARPMRLEDAPGGRDYIAADDVIARGKIAFAERCAGCHSSKRPSSGIDPRAPEGKSWFRQSVLQPDFRDHNFLSSDQRYPVTLIQTNACRALATNAVRGHVWDNFSSETYKTLPSVGTIDVDDPFDGTTRRFPMPSGGPGYYRPPSLISLWASAPFFHNNALGEYMGDPSVAGRMRAFQDAVEKLLWPAKRLGTGSIWRTTEESYLEIPATYLPKVLAALADGDSYRIGPIPAGTPVGLLANVDLDIRDPLRLARLVTLGFEIRNRLLEIRRRHLDAEASTALLKSLVPDLLDASKCPDFVADRGHYFGADLTDADKRALIEFLKTL